MRKLKILLSSIGVLFIAISANTQTNNITIPEADFSGTIVFVKVENQSIQLENTRSAFKQKQNALHFFTGGLAGRSGLKLLANGKTSPVRIEIKPKMYFLYTSDENFSNPNDVIVLLKFDNTTDGNRVSTLVDMVGVVAGDKKSYENFISFQAVKYKSKSYLITVDAIEPGEYGFVLGKVSSVNKNGTAPIIHMFTAVPKTN